MKERQRKEREREREGKEERRKKSERKNFPSLSDKLSLIVVDSDLTSRPLEYYECM